MVQRFKKPLKNAQALAAVLIVSGIIILGVRLLSASHAEGPYVATAASSGALVSPASLVTGDNNDKAVQFGKATTTSGSAPALPSGVTGTFMSSETGAELYSDSGWQKSTNADLTPSSGCSAFDTASITVSGTYLDLYTPGATESWDCSGVESNAEYSDGHIFQLREYIPAAANGNIADYPAWWLNDTPWSMEFDMAEAHDWGTTTPIDGQMCLDIHLDQGTENTSPNCQTEVGGWHVYTAVWASNGNLTMYYDGTQMNPNGVSGSTLTDSHMIIWNNNNGGSGTVNSTVQIDYLAEWSTN
jgi:hypothetical protein